MKKHETIYLSIHDSPWSRSSSNGSYTLRGKDVYIKGGPMSVAFIKMWLRLWGIKYDKVYVTFEQVYDCRYDCTSGQLAAAL